MECSGGRARETACGGVPPGLVERSKALVCRNLFQEESRTLRLGRFELVRTLGRGASGIVYEAVDSSYDERIALKALHRRGPSHVPASRRCARAHAEARGLIDRARGQWTFTLPMLPIARSTNEANRNRPAMSRR